MRSTRSIFPLRSNRRCAWAISIRIMGSPEGFAKSPRIWKLPLLVESISPGFKPRSVARFFSRKIVVSFSRKSTYVCRFLTSVSLKGALLSSGRIERSRKGSIPRTLTDSPVLSFIFLSTTGEKYLTAGSSMSFSRVFSSRGPAGLSITWVDFPRRKSTAMAKLVRAERADTVIPITAATPQAIPRSCKTERPGRLIK